MPRKKPEPDHAKSSLTFTIETFDDPETGEPTQYGRFTQKQALMQARKLEATTPDNLEIQNFIANRLWALGSQDEAAEVYEPRLGAQIGHRNWTRVSPVATTAHSGSCNGVLCGAGALQGDAHAPEGEQARGVAHTAAGATQKDSASNGQSARWTQDQRTDGN